MNRTEQKEKRRQEILFASLDLFICKGYAATKTADIAKAVGMSDGLLFHYFDTKEKLYLALLEFSDTGPQNIFKLTDMPPLKFFENAAEQIIDNIVKMPFVAKLFVLSSQAQYNEALPQDVRNSLMRPELMEKTIQLIKQGQSDKTIREGNPVALALAFWMAIQGIAENIAKNPEMPVPKSEWIVDIIRSKSNDKN